MPAPHQTGEPSEGRLRGCSIAALAAAGGLIVGLPAIAVAFGVVRHLAEGAGSVAPEAGALDVAEAGGWVFVWGRTALVAVGLALASTLLAVPCGLVLAAGRRSGGWIALAILPALMPAYLAYAGYSILRDPTTATGDWLGRQGNAVNFAAGQLVALATLALWMHPLCALVLAHGIGRVPRSVDEQLRLDGAGAVRRTFELLRASRGVVVVSILTATVVFLGSAVPLHLAQVWTGAITVWRVLDKSLTPWPAWAASWPLLGMAAAVGVWAGWYGLRAATAEAEPALGPKPAPGWFGWAALLWAVGGVLPVGLFAWSLGSIAPVVRFWRERAEAIGESLFVAAVVGVASALLAACVWAVCFAGGGVRAGGASRLGLVLVAGAFAGAAALPGVLVGSAVRAAWVWAPEAIGGWVTGGPTILVLAHVARLGIIAVGAGVLLAAGEPSSLRDTRALDGAIGWAAFWRAGLAERWPGLVGVALVCAALSVGEVEATIIVQPPGSEPLARVLLDLLHYLKMQDLAAAAVTLIGGSGVVSAVGAGLIARTRRRELP